MLRGNRTRESERNPERNIENPTIARTLLRALTFQNMKWAYWIVRSRSVSTYNGDLCESTSWLERGTSFDNWALCPMFDMVNHRHSYTL